MNRQEPVTRKKYTSDYKRNAVELVLSGNRSCRSVERDLGIPQGILHRWMKEYRSDTKNCFPGIGKKKLSCTSTDPSVLSLKGSLKNNLSV
jgi:transposase